MSSTQIVPSSSGMSEYERDAWERLNKHWESRRERRQLPDWARKSLSTAKDTTERGVTKIVNVIPEPVKATVRKSSDAVVDVAMRPLINSTLSLLKLVNDWVRDLNDPKTVESLARKRGHDIKSFHDLANLDLSVCDRLLTRHTLKWRTIGALEGGGMSLLAYIPVAGLPVAITADIVVIQALSNSIAARIAYSYGYDAKDPAEEEFIQRLVFRSFLAQAAKTGSLKNVVNARHAVKNRVNWSNKLRNDHRLTAALEALLKRMGPTGARVPVSHVAKALPVVGIVIGAGTNAAILGTVAKDAKRYCQTRFLSEKYDLPMPAALVDALEEDLEAEIG